MKNIITDIGAGIAIDCYGDETNKIIEGIKNLELNYNFYKNNSISNNKKYKWELQNDKKNYLE